MVRLVVGAIRHVLQAHRWGPAFASNGLDGSQARVSKYIRQNLELENLPSYPPERPTIDVLRLCWPRNRAVNEAAVFEAFPAEEPLVEMHALPGFAPAAPPAELLDANAFAAPSAMLPAPPSAHAGASSRSAADDAVDSFWAMVDSQPPESPAPTPRQRLRQQTKKFLKTTRRLTRN